MEDLKLKNTVTKIKNFIWMSLTASKHNLKQEDRKKNIENHARWNKSIKM